MGFRQGEGEIKFSVICNWNLLSDAFSHFSLIARHEGNSCGHNDSFQLIHLNFFLLYEYEKIKIEKVFHLNCIWSKREKKNWNEWCRKCLLNGKCGNVDWWCLMCGWKKAIKKNPFLCRLKFLLEQLECRLPVGCFIGSWKCGF